jgi:ribosomal protein S15P/S13E
MAIDELDREKRRRIKELEKRREKLLEYLRAAGGYDADIESELDEIDEELIEMEES